ncbi:hypothetical protein QU487_06520 [Crenobacter sp. SG2305]|uniref:hypothetical protein n=1 Tax=Crenobacter oryzisoli TaxID=3056844 RepID=UPI0025AA37A0|nr:hypothetical protein [Crenobacter sp. SG2305]MDN0082407.1 hypothetical protein [Crenobacter sp. SG2305]
MLTSEQLKLLAGQGGGFIIRASDYSAEDLKHIAGFAASSGARLTFKSCGHLSPTDLNQIAGFGQGAVVFDFTS